MRIRWQSFSWVVPVTSIVSSAMFAARAASHVIEAVYFEEAPRSEVRARPASQPTAPPRRAKDGRQLVERNMFCSECTPAPASAGDPSQVPVTSLPLVLVATAISAVRSSSLASIEDTSNGHHGAFREGDAVPGGGAIVAIRHQSVDFERAGRIERLLLGGARAESPVMAAAAPAPAAPASQGAEGDVAAVLQSGIRKVDETTYELDRALVDQALANPLAFVKGARVTPALVDGKPVGFRVSAVRKGSAMDLLGLRNGDTLRAVNGVELGSIEAAMNLYTKLRELTSLEMTIDRRGKPATLRYAVR